MVQHVRRLFAGQESAQALIFAAILMPVLLGFMGLAIFGGQAYVKHQQLQAAADTSALVGAQDLPCKTDATGTACVTTAETDACAYAAKNGFGGCTAGGTVNSSADVPPLSCSPYDFLNYGNEAINSKCKNTTVPADYDTVEVRLSAKIATVPIFHIPVTLYAHAVAHRGTPSPHGYTFVALGSQGISMTQSNQTQIEGAAFSNGPITGDGSNIACGGGWFSSGTVTNVETGGTPTKYSPLTCTASTGTPLTAPSQPPITDPFAGSVPPTASVWSGSSCPECASPGHWIDLNSGTWGVGGTPSGVVRSTAGTASGCLGKKGTQSIEMFPGVYTSLPGGAELPDGTGVASKISCVFMNPGVYTFTATVDPSLNNLSEHIGTLCIFGSPSCDSGDNKGQCDDAKFTNGLDGGDKYYYQCAPWGFWDSSSFGGTRPSNLPVAPPTWYNASTSSWSTVPINGVTLYFPENALELGLTTHSGTSSSSLAAAPNPCPGTGTRFTAGSGTTAGSVQFPEGNASALYTYPATSLVALHGLTGSQTYSGSATPYSLVYSSDDITTLGECHLPYVEWPKAMLAPQHVNFLVYEQGPMNNTFFGTDDMTWQGIFYDPSGAITFTGKSGAEGSSGAEGIPWLIGQVVVDHADFHGTSDVQIVYLPCAPGSLACLAGNALQLVE